MQALGLATGSPVGTSGTAAGILGAAMGPGAAPGLAIAVLGAVTANVLNVDTAGISTLAVGLRLPRGWMAACFGLAGGALSWTATVRIPADLEDFLLLISYGVAPWIDVLLA